jgi:uncharacterized protein YqeY
VAEHARPADLIRDQLSLALREAMRERDGIARAALRTLISALDNATAVEAPKHRPVFGLAGDVPRYELTEADIVRVFTVETDERKAAIVDYQHRGLPAEAERLRQELAVIERFRPDWSGVE